MSTYGESLDIALHLKYVENQEVKMHITDYDYRKIGDGLIEKVDNWLDLLGQGYIWYVDGCEHGRRQDWLREQGEAVFGSSEAGARLEEERQKGQALFKKMGLYQPESHNFKDIDVAIGFIKSHPDKKWILKQNGDAPKSINHKTKFDGGIDMLYHLEKLKKSWNESDYGVFDCDLMEQVEGLEVAVSGFWNGHDWIRNKEGKIVAFLNFEHKKESNGDMGETTGETGTVFVTADESHKLVKLLLENQTLKEILTATGFRGVFDINGCMTQRGYVGFEPTMRPGIPSSSWEMLSGAGLNSRTSLLLEAVAKGQDIPINPFIGTGIVVVVTAKPYPIVEADTTAENSLGEKLWIIKNDKIVEDFDIDQRLHIHLANFYKDGSDYLVATKSGYLYTVTMRGRNVKDCRVKVLDYIKKNTYISGMKYRTDIGEKLEAKGF